jgi:hypothetical protein
MVALAHTVALVDTVTLVLTVVSRVSRDFRHSELVCASSFF